MNKRKITTYVCACILLAIFIDFIHKRLLNGQSSSNGIKFKSNDDSDEIDWLKDWQNYEDIEKALHMKGLGEVGKPANISEFRKELYDKYGFDAMLSDYISLQRSVPDMRTTACKNITYLANLPRSAIIIIFYNELLSVLLRTVYSILNRTPTELLQEIILVDDGSTWSDMQEELELNLRIHFSTKNNKVRLIRQSTRSGIMSARMAGARNASKEAEVLIFLDSHFEVGYNWLPPLLEPIEIDPRTCTCPIIDRVAFDDFRYTANAPWRGFFDYSLNYGMRPLRLSETAQPEKNFKNYVMMGGAMAIGSDFFWKLGGFDEGMTHWGGEQFEMSFKIWMCGGQLLDAPCSRMGHLFRDPNTKGNKILYDDYSFIRKKRLIDVWIDAKNQEYFFKRRSDLKDVDVGNLTDRKLIRQKLQCKNFSWMIENVMPDVHDVFLPVEPFDLASGLIRSVFDPNLCLAVGVGKLGILEQCHAQNEYIEENKQLHYTWRGELRIFGYECLESDVHSNKVTSYGCHFSWGNQKWYYDREMQWITKFDKKLCIFANIEELRIQLTPCEKGNLKLKWTFSHINNTEMDKWDSKLKLNLNL